MTLQIDSESLSKSDENPERVENKESGNLIDNVNNILLGKITSSFKVMKKYSFSETPFLFSRNTDRKRGKVIDYTTQLTRNGLKYTNLKKVILPITL